MINFEIEGKEYSVTNDYKHSRSAWVNTLEENTKKLVLDYTIMWNMIEHQVYNDAYNKDKNNQCIHKVVISEYSKDRINYIWNLFTIYRAKYDSIEEFYASFAFEKSHISLSEILQLYNSIEIEDRLRLLIYSCYRVRCNLFHGPKCIFDLNDQKLLFLSMNELLSLISRVYGM